MVITMADGGKDNGGGEETLVSGLCETGGGMSVEDSAESGKPGKKSARIPTTNLIMIITETCELKQFQ